MKILLFLLPYILIIYGAGLKTQNWLRQDYQQYLDNFNGRNLYIAPYDFTWWHWWLMSFFLFMIILNLALLVNTLRKQND